MSQAAVKVTEKRKSKQSSTISDHPFILFEQLNDLIRKDSKSFDKNERAMNTSDKENAHYEENHFMVRVCTSQFWGVFSTQPNLIKGRIPNQSQA